MLKYVLELENRAPGSSPSSIVQGTGGLHCTTTLTTGQLWRPLGAKGLGSDTGSVATQGLPQPLNQSQHGKCPTASGSRSFGMDTASLPSAVHCICVPEMARQLRVPQGAAGYSGDSGAPDGEWCLRPKTYWYLCKAHVSSCDFIWTLAVQGLRWKLLLLLVIFP